MGTARACVLALAIGLTGCPSDEVGSDDRGRAGDACGPEIRECVVGLVCLAGRCREACVTNTDCTSLDVCDEGVCMGLDEYCAALDNVGSTAVDTTARACVIEDCAPGWEDLDGVWANGCEEICAPTGPDRCNGADDDCSGQADDIVDVGADCGSRFPSAVGVAGWLCTGVCEIAGCLAGFADINGAVADGCELECTPTGSEVCDGLDNDCNAAVDDVPAGALTAECTTELPGAGQVAAWDCVAGACAIGECVSGWSDIANGTTDGCEAACVPTAPPTEVCDGSDNDCDGATDPEDAPGCVVYYNDDDGDGLGGVAFRCLCEPSAPFTVTVSGDCDESLASCNTDCATDADADGAVDCADTCVDWDADGYGAPGGLGDSCLGSDCDDVPTGCGVDCNPGLVEVCDGQDNDCADGVDVPLGPSPLCGQQLGVCEGSSSPGCSGASGWQSCGNSTYDSWAQSQFGVSYDSSGSNDSPCDFFDNDCDGEVDDGCELAIEVFDNNNSILNPEMVVALAVDGDGDLWVVNSANELFYLPFGASDFEQVTLVTPNGPVTAMVTDASDDLWLGFETWCTSDDDNDPPCDCGAWRILADRSAAEFICTEALSNRDNWVTALAADATGRVFIGTPDDMTVYFPPPDNVIGCDINVPGGDVASLAVDDNPPGRLFIGLNSNDIRLCETELVTGPSSCSTSCMTDDLPFGFGGNGLNAIDFWDHGTPADRSDDFLVVGEGGDGGGGPGRGNLAIYDIDNQRSVRDWRRNTRAAVFDRTRGWAFSGGMNEGLTLIRNVDNPSTQTFDPGDGLPDDDVFALAFDQAHGILWIGTDRGVARVRFYQ